MHTKMDALQAKDKARDQTERKRDLLALRSKDVQLKVRKYDRQRIRASTKALKDRKLKGLIKKRAKQSEHAAIKAARAELLLLEEPGYLEAEGEMERTYRLKQKDLVKEVDVTSASKFFELKLDTFGPYSVNYSRNGRFLLIGGRRGHLATFDWSTKKLGCEFHVQETVRDVKYLHNELMFAVAQKEYVYIYDNTGTELHRLSQHHRVSRLDFLPFHFLLVSVGERGALRYHDVSTGQFLVEHRTKAGPCDCLSHNPHNAIVYCGHSNGTVTLWSPNMAAPLVKMLCHRGPVRSVAMDTGGQYMVTSGMDAQLKVWDVRTFRPVHAYYTPCPAAGVAVSQRGLLALGAGREVQVWQDALRVKQRTPYLQHRLAGEADHSLQFCPFEDVLAVGHERGVSSLLVPGAGEPNYDALEVNPYQTKRQRQEAEVKQLLEKIPADLITLDPAHVLKVDQADQEVPSAERKVEEAANHAHRQARERVRARGKGRVHKVVARRLATKERLRRDLLRAKRIAEMEAAKQSAASEWRQAAEESAQQASALERFSAKPKPKDKGKT